ncbi:MAG: Mur ligase domain-containing protein [Bacteroidales bacterium]|jgi:UDP-N-acetylmuramate: L-alanyl-gamma-D-glutamyl-meso-diaminopimelate ligase|nr:Mur ligase domain-containing protein [Bacteroidales bacterium]
MKVHFIAIGGSAMHNLAIALKTKGDIVSGSDDEIFEPARSNLAKYDILPDKEGWYEEKITEDIDCIVLGMHAKSDNPELVAAQQKGIKIYSYPEYLYQASKDKIRIVIGGSHGKTTITAIILHVFKYLNIETDYMVGAKLDGFEVMVRISDTAKYMVIEGDEYLTSPLDLRPKFHLYNPTIALISGIAWDHINVFPTFDNYVEQFRIFINKITIDGTLVYCDEDKILSQTVKENSRTDIAKLPYKVFPHHINNGITIIDYNGKEYPLQVFGKHNLSNISGAMLVCEQIGIKTEDFLQKISSFKGAAKRLELINSGEKTAIYKDFAHSPSKLKATITAVKEQYPERKLIVCLELHTYSSLTSEFLQQYKGTMDKADTAVIFYNPHAVTLKRLPMIEPKFIKASFSYPNLHIFTDKISLENFLLEQNFNNTNLLMCSSGNFDAMDINAISQKILE